MADNMADAEEQQITAVAAPDANAEADQVSENSRRQIKATQRRQKQLAQEFEQALDGVQKQQELRMQQGGAAGALAKERRKDVRSVLKAITDASTPIEERLRLLQTKYVAALQDQLKQDKQLCEAQERLEASNKEAQAGRAELTRTQQKFDSLQKLARGLSAENKALQEDAGRYRKQNDKVQDMLKGVQATIDNQQQETHKVFEHNQLLAEENARLKQQLDRTQQVVEDLSTTQKDRLAALSEQLTQQNDAMAQASKLHEVLSQVMKENETLTLKAALASTLEERNKVLEKAFAEAQAQSTHHRQQLQEMEASLKQATKVLQGFDKMQKSMSDQQQITTQLMQERQLLQGQVVTLQQQAREQADKLRRVGLQKQRLEALCRTLQARAGGGCVSDNSLAGGDDPASADADAATTDTLQSPPASDSCPAHDTASGSAAPQPSTPNTEAVEQVSVDEVEGAGAGKKGEELACSE